MGWSLVLVLSLLVYSCSPSICDLGQCSCSVFGKSWIKATCLFNGSQRELDISPVTLPRNLSELVISGVRDVVISSGSFSSNLSGLSLVRLTDLQTLTVQTKAFARLTCPNLRLEVARVLRVILETNAFHEFKTSTMTAQLERLGNLIVHERAFDHIISLDISRVDRLVLQPNAFFYNPDSRGMENPGAKIKLDRVRAKELPLNVFPSLNQLTISHSSVETVRCGAFQALLLTSVRLSNTTLGVVETNAFTSRSAIGLLELEGVTAGSLQTDCVQSGISVLTVRGSSFTEVAEFAFHTASATVSLAENVFNRVRTRGFTFKETSSLAVENNRFNILEDSAFVLQERESGSGPPVNLTFRGNSFGREIGRDALDFSRSNQSGTNVQSNNFDRPCHCEEISKNWLRERINGSERVVDLFYESSQCQVTLDLARCFSLPKGVFAMENFSSLACGSESEYYCPEVAQSDAAVPYFPGTTSDIVSDISSDRERKVLVIILLFVVSGVVLMLVLTGLMWLRRHGYCTKARLLLLPSADSVFDILSRAVSGPAAAPGVAPHEYAELQQAHKPVEEEDYAPLEDKATQTLPEELTQELLQTLRDKLDDPDNYSEARDMIEHLYDLIKVEESCNQNSDSISLRLEELEDLPEGENLYDVIGPKPRPPRPRPRAPSDKRSLVSVGTRAPSPDKLLPLSLSRLRAPPTLPALLCDYTEPRDLALHVYQEIPPVAATDTTPMANRPLPSKPDPGEGPSR